MKTLLLTIILSFLTTPKSVVFAADSIKEIRVFKDQRRIELIDNNDHVLNSYKIRLGLNPIGAKKESGDNKTPEGIYFLDWKVSNSKFHKALHISYPNVRDKIKAGMHGKSPGGDIMLHGYPEDFSEMSDWLKSVNLDGAGDDLVRASLENYDWTNGCIAVSDEVIDELFSKIETPMKIIINQ